MVILQAGTDTPYVINLIIFKNFNTYVTCLFKNMFNFYMYVSFSDFLLLLVSFLLLLWLGKILCIISVFLNEFKLFLWPKVWSVLDNAPCAFENIADIEWSVL